MTTEKEYKEVCAWRDAAVADGWEIKANFPRTVGADQSAILNHPEGFKAITFTRVREGAFEVSLGVWGPDGLLIRAPEIYDMAAIRADVTCCHYCNAKDIKPIRVSFVGRACEACAANYPRPEWWKTAKRKPR